MPGFDYHGAFHVTVVTRAREPLLTGALASTVADALNRVATKLSVELWAYCVMPDHVHILVHCPDNSVSLVEYIQRFKQRTSHAHIARDGKRLWQPSFHDHAVRKHEDIDTVAAYIFDNPVEAGLIADADEWPYSGGTLLPLQPGAAKATQLRPDTLT
jgi:REP element-mobilizing transposase RayT